MVVDCESLSMLWLCLATLAIVGIVVGTPEQAESESNEDLRKLGATDN